MFGGLNGLVEFHVQVQKFRGVGVLIGFINPGIR